MHDPAAYRDFIFRSQAEPETDPGPPPPKDEAEQAYARLLEAARGDDYAPASLYRDFARVSGVVPQEEAASPDTDADGKLTNADGNPAWISIHVPEVRHDPRYADQKSSLSFSAFPKGLLRRWSKDPDASGSASGKDGPEKAAPGGGDVSGAHPKPRRPGFLSILLWGCLAGLGIWIVSFFR